MSATAPCHTAHHALVFSRQAAERRSSTDSTRPSVRPGLGVGLGVTKGARRGNLPAQRALPGKTALQMACAVAVAVASPSAVGLYTSKKKPPDTLVRGRVRLGLVLGVGFGLGFGLGFVSGRSATGPGGSTSPPPGSPLPHLGEPRSASSHPVHRRPAEPEPYPNLCLAARKCPNAQLPLPVSLSLALPSIFTPALEGEHKGRWIRG